MEFLDIPVQLAQVHGRRLVDRRVVGELEWCVQSNARFRNPTYDSTEVVNAVRRNSARRQLLARIKHEGRAAIHEARRRHLAGRARARGAAGPN